jgi:hypothetical protein
MLKQDDPASLPLAVAAPKIQRNFALGERKNCRRGVGPPQILRRERSETSNATGMVFVRIPVTPEPGGASFPSTRRRAAAEEA